MSMAQKKAELTADDYQYRVGWSEEDGVYVGRVAEFQLLAAHGPTLEAALREIKKVVRTVLDDLAESGEGIPEPFGKRKFSGKFIVRVPESRHRELAIRAAEEGVSLNQLVNSKLEK
jgi:predicted HicB family RNase H-like nuclease